MKVKIYRWAIALGIGMMIAVVNSYGGLLPAKAQYIPPEVVASRVYENLSQIPRENQYISQETEKIAANNTLVSRLIRYHEYIKNRPLIYRLDWQLTLADYLGVNEPISASNYPGKTTLKNHPLEGDRAAINSLSRSQRNQLIELLVSIYNPQSQSTSADSNPQPQSSPANSNTNNNRNNRPIPQRGSADLLLPQ